MGTMGKMGVWEELVANVTRSKPLKRTLLIIGGSKEAQNSFIKSLYVKDESRLREEHNRIANDIYLGYTYIQYKDNSQELLSTLQVYTLPGEFKQAYTRVLGIVLKHLSVDDVLLVPLLDYTENPQHWLRELSLVLQTVKTIQGGALPQLVTVVVNKNSRIDWDQEVHEYIQLCLRSVMLRETGSLVYTNLLKQNPKIVEFISSALSFPIKENYRVKIEPNFTDHTELLIPQGADSWGKIKTLSEDVDPESISRTWKLGESDTEFITTYEKLIPPVVKKEKKRREEPALPPNVPFQEFLQGLYENRKSKGQIFKQLAGRDT